MFLSLQVTRWIWHEKFTEPQKEVFCFKSGHPFVKHVGCIMAEFGAPLPLGDQEKDVKTCGTVPHAETWRSVSPSVAKEGLKSEAMFYVAGKSQSSIICVPKFELVIPGGSQNSCLV